MSLLLHSLLWTIFTSFYMNLMQLAIPRSQITSDDLLMLHALVRPLTGVWVLCEYTLVYRILALPFLDLSLLVRCYLFVPITSVFMLPLPWVFTEVIITLYLSYNVLRIIRVNINWMHHSMIQGQMVFHEIINEIVFFQFTKYLKMTLFDTVSSPLKYHVNFYIAFLFDCYVNYST